MTVSAPDIERAFLAAESDDSVEALVRQLVASNEASTIASALAHSDSYQVRAWVADLAPRLGRSECSVGLLERLSNDGDADVREAALFSLSALDPVAAHAFLPRVRRAANAKDEYDAAAALWLLAALDDRESEELVSHLRNRATGAVLRNTATAVGLLFRSPTLLLQRISDHDHDLMPWLTRAGEFVPADLSAPVLSTGAKALPDEECRRFCQDALNTVLQRQHHQPD